MISPQSSDLAEARFIAVLAAGPWPVTWDDGPDGAVAISIPPGPAIRQGQRAGPWFVPSTLRVPISPERSGQSVLEVSRSW